MGSLISEPSQEPQQHRSIATCNKSLTQTVEGRRVNRRHRVGRKRLKINKKNLSIQQKKRCKDFLKPLIEEGKKKKKMWLTLLLTRHKHTNKNVAQHNGLWNCRNVLQHCKTYVFTKVYFSCSAEEDFLYWYRFWNTCSSFEEWAKFEPVWMQIPRTGHIKIRQSNWITGLRGQELQSKTGQCRKLDIQTLWQHFTVHTYTLANPRMHLLCRRGGWWRPGWHQPGQNGHGASCDGRRAGPWPWRRPAVAGGSSPARSRPAPGRNASSWPDAGAGRWGGTPAGTGQSPCSGGTRYIAGNNLEAAEEERHKRHYETEWLHLYSVYNDWATEKTSKWDTMEYNGCALFIPNEETTLLQHQQQYKNKIYSKNLHAGSNLKV